MSRGALLGQSLFSKSLSTMVKGIRSHREKGPSHEEEYISKCISEIKSELQSPFPDVKCNALQKLLHLQMMNFDISWASFHIVEMMSSTWFGHRRVGFLAAQLSFSPTTDVILLTSNLFRKTFTGGGGGNRSNLNEIVVEGQQYEIGAAVSCLSSIATADLAQDLYQEVLSLTNSSRPYIRKKATLLLLKLFKQWPKALRLCFDRLKEKLEDDNPGVVSSAVYVICELASKNPKNYLGLAPQFFNILTTSSNNWVLIKVIKLLGALVPLEPRLAKKLQEPLTDIITTTPAKSLLFECVNTLLCGELKSKTVVRLCLDKLKEFIEDHDQNLKYLGLLGLHKLMKAHPKIVAEHKDLVLNCLGDDDVTIRMRALDLITSLASQSNLQGIVKKLIEHLEASEGQYREHVLERIINICSQDNYAYVADFEWYLGILVKLTFLTGVSKENSLRITHQLLDVSIRVPAVRRSSVKAMSEILISGRLLNSKTSSGLMSEVLYSAAFVVGEFSEWIEGQFGDLVHVLTQQEVTALPSHVQIIFLQSAFKVLAAAFNQPYEGGFNESDATDEKDDQRLKSNDEEGNDDDESNDVDHFGVKKRRVPSSVRSFDDWLRFVGVMLAILRRHIKFFIVANSVEVQERAMAYSQFTEWIFKYGGFALVEEKEKTMEESKENTNSLPSPRPTLLPKLQYRKLGIQLNLLFSERLNPINPKAQSKVPLPKGLDLDSTINAESEINSDESEDDEYEDEPKGGSGKKEKEKEKEKDKDGKKKKKKGNSWGEDTVEDKAAATARLKAREEAKANDPFYLKDKKSSTASSSLLQRDVNDIPIKQLDSSDLPPLTVSTSSAKKKKKEKKENDEDDIFNPKPVKPTKAFKVIKEEEGPKVKGKMKEKEKERKAEDDEGEDEETKQKGKEKEKKKEKDKERTKKEDEDEEEKKSSKKKKDKDKEKPKKDKKEKKKEKSADGENEEAKPKKAKKSKEKEKENTSKEAESGSSSSAAPSAAPAPAPQPSLFDLFDPLQK